MQSTAYTKSARISTRKVRLVADMIRNLSVSRALDVLSLSDKRAATDIEKTLKSALANALMQNENVDYDTLVIKTIEVNEGPALKRFRPSTRGRVHPYKKRSSHIKIILNGSEKINKKTETKKEEKENE